MFQIILVIKKISYCLKNSVLVIIFISLNSTKTKNKDKKVLVGRPNLKPPITQPAHFGTSGQKKKINTWCVSARKTNTDLKIKQVTSHYLGLQEHRLHQMLQRVQSTFMITQRSDMYTVILKQVTYYLMKASEQRYLLNTIYPYFIVL